MKRLSLALSFTLGLAQIIIAQVITAVPCDMLGMVMNVGSQENSISIYHSGQYMTSPQSENIFIWEFTDQDGNILHQETIVNQQTIAFGHNWLLTDTINVTVHFVNDSANLDNWYISEGMQPNGNSINCLFEDQIYWSTGDSTPWGSWTFIHNNPGVDQNTINNCCINPEWINLMAPCPFIEDPVTGCDGVEYANYCVAEAAGITSYIDSMGNETVLEWECNQGGDDCIDDPDGMVAQYGSSCSELAILGCDADLSAFIDGIGFGISVYEICPESCSDCGENDCIDDPDGILESFQAYQCNDIVGSWFSWGCDDDLSVAVPEAPSGMWTIGDLCPQSCDACEEVQCEQDLDNDGICEDYCEDMLMTVVDCECSFFNPNTYTVFFSTVNEESCELWEDCYCECYNDIDGDGICDEDEENVNIEELFKNKKLLKKLDFLGRDIERNTEFQLLIYDDGSIEKKYILK